MDFGQHIKGLRKKKGISARELAKLSDISQAYLSQLETGKFTNPTPAVISKLAESLDVDYISLVAETDMFKTLVQEQANREIAKIPDLDKLLNSEEYLLFKGQLLQEDEKKKIITLIETILS